MELNPVFLGQEVVKHMLKLYGLVFDKKNWKLIYCCQSYLSYYLFIFLIYHNILLWRERFYWNRPGSCCYKT